MKLTHNLKKNGENSKGSLRISNLHVRTLDEKVILNGVSLTVNQGETHVIMGPNGGGKSTFAQAIMGSPDYVVTRGTIELNGVDITNKPVNERAKAGLFLGFQYPVEVAGVNIGSFLRMAANEKVEPGGKKLSPIAFRNKASAAANTLGLSDEILKRSLNEGFSGGEKKKSEILQLALLRPAFAVLDEPDSGLDVDALRYIGDAVNGLDYPLGLVLITHYRRILDYIKPQFVHVMIEGKIVLSGDYNLAKEIEKKGYEQFSV